MMDDRPTSPRNLSPNAKVLVFNFAYRGTVADDKALGTGEGGRSVASISPSSTTGADPKSDLQYKNRPDRITLSMVDIIDIETSKSKMKPDGQFQVLLAPTKNWIAELVPGSWIVLMMAAEGQIPEGAILRADPNYVKMVGRISSVRVSVSVDQSGARKMQYVINGSDWGDIFNTNAYINNNVFAYPAKDSKLDVISTLLGQYYNQLNRTARDIAIAVRPRTVARALLNFLGKKTELVETSIALRKARITFSIPQSLGDFLQGTERNKLIASKGQGKDRINLDSPTDLATFLDVIGGVVGNTNYKIAGQISSDISTGARVYKTPNNYRGEAQPNEYDDTKNECRIELPPSALNGIYTLWQILSTAQVDALNEMYCELDLWNYATYRKTNDGKEVGTTNLLTPFTLVIRPRPFVVRDNPFVLHNDQSMYGGFALKDPEERTLLAYAAVYASYFKALRRCPIQLDSVMSFGAAASWESKVNFIDIRIESIDNSQQGRAVANAKLMLGVGQTYDVTSIERDGLRPMIRTIRALPPTSEYDDVKAPPVTKVKAKSKAPKNTKKTKLTASQTLKTETTKTKTKTTTQFVAPWADVKKAIKTIIKEVKIKGTTNTIKKYILNENDLITEETYTDNKRVPGETKTYTRADEVWAQILRAQFPTELARIDTASDRSPAGITDEALGLREQNTASTKAAQAKAQEQANAQVASTIRVGAEDRASSYNPLWSWKYLMREWHFDSHRMLNGTITFVGHDWPFLVGCNLIVSAKVLGPAMNTTLNMAKGLEVYLLAHIENVTHKFSVDGTGARRYLTSVQFVRGIFTDASGNLVDGLDDPIGNPFNKKYRYGMLDRELTDTEGLTVNANVNEKGD